MQTERVTPVYAWVLLGIAVLAVSSAGAVFRMIEVDPLLKAAWRLQATALVLLPFFLWQLRTTEFTFERRTLWILVASGGFLWIHFASWVWSLDHTSLTHSLLFVTAHPIIIVIGMGMLRITPHRFEVWAAILGVTGAAIALQDVKSDGDVTLLGDAAAFLGAIAVVGYLAAGRILRSEKEMPLFLYAFPVTAIAALLLTVHSMASEGSTLDIAVADTSVFGWVDPMWLLLVAYLALGPGFAGHTGINASLRWLPPLVISVSVVLEPMLGSFIGWSLGVEDVPGFWTWVGGPFMIAGTFAAILGANRRLTQEGAAHEAE